MSELEQLADRLGQIIFRLECNHAVIARHISGVDGLLDDAALQTGRDIENLKELKNRLLVQEELQRYAHRHLPSRIKEIALKHCADYPRIAEVDPWEQLYALEGSLEGITQANNDLHRIVDELRQKCGLTKEQVIEMSKPILGHWQELSKAMDALIGPNPPPPVRGKQADTIIVDDYTKTS